MTYLSGGAVMLDGLVSLVMLRVLGVEPLHLVLNSVPITDFIVTGHVVVVIAGCLV